MAPTSEADIRQLCEAGDYDRAATRAIESCGAEIRRFIARRARNKADARDIFSVFCEDLWLGLSRFSWSSSLRVWAYTIARHAATRYLKSPVNRSDLVVVLTDVAASFDEPPITDTQGGGDVDATLRAMRSRLCEEDQRIVSLRVDRNLGWKDIARLMSGSVASPPPEQMLREEARIRKRFQLIKDRMRRWVTEDKLLPAS